MTKQVGLKICMLLFVLLMICSIIVHSPVLLFLNLIGFLCSYDAVTEDLSGWVRRC